MRERPARWRAGLAAALARRRVTLGFVLGPLVFWLAHPTAFTLALGFGMAAVGEGLRVWAAGHLNKSREVTSSGPYRWFAHPLYVGSSVIGAGFAVASGSAAAALVIAIYLGVTLTAAVRTEEAFLRGAFGDRYDRYRRGAAVDAADAAGRRFRVSQALANQEHRAVLGFAAVALLLALKASRGWPLW